MGLEYLPTLIPFSTTPMYLIVSINMQVIASRQLVFGRSKDAERCGPKT